MRRVPFRPTSDSRSSSPRIAARACGSRLNTARNLGRGAFSLVELLVVLAIVVILTSMLMPGLRAVRESANRLHCSSNMRQIGCALTCYATDNSEFLPYSYFGSYDVKLPQETMAITIGPGDPHYEGIGRLLPHCGCYLDCAQCLYCPNHHGEHTLDRYQPSLDRPADNERAYGTYQYRGDADPVTGKRYLMSNEHSFIMLTDGLRTISDFNHVDGLNLLHGDLAVTWYSDVDHKLQDQLPESANMETLPPLFDDLWKTFSEVDK